MCRRPLRSPLWRARGVGPICARRAGLVRSRQCATVLIRPVRAAVGGGQMELFELAAEGVA